MARLIAWIIILLPAGLAAWGVKLLRDALFFRLANPFSSLWLQTVSGFFLSFAGIAFLGGFIYRRDRKRNKVVKRLGRRNL
jgi:Protein of unknown function (DUF2627).